MLNSKPESISVSLVKERAVHTFVLPNRRLLRHPDLAHGCCEVVTACRCESWLDCNPVFLGLVFGHPFLSGGWGKGRREGGREGGRKRGREEGRKAGRKEGTEGGRKEGSKEERNERREEGRKKGMSEGRKEGRKDRRNTDMQ